MDGTRGLEIEEDVLILFFDEVEPDERSSEDDYCWLVMSCEETTLRYVLNFWELQFVPIMNYENDMPFSE
ncbi:hypothetical protein KI387_027162, partial [Taxus chinensis]